MRLWKFVYNPFLSSICGKSETIQHPYLIISLDHSPSWRAFLSDKTDATSERKNYNTVHAGSCTQNILTVPL